MKLSANADITTAAKLVELGYDAIDVGLCRVIYHDDPYPHNPLLDEDDYESRLDEYIEECRRLGLTIATSHIPYRFNYADPTSEDYEYKYAMTCRALRASEYMGAEWTVVHMKTAPETIAYVRRLVADSGVSRIGIAIENINGYPLEDLIEACDTLEAEGYRVGVCFDTGHCHLNKYYDYDVADSIRLLGKRIKMLHVHDNNYRMDQHTLPYLGKINWDEVTKALGEIDYTGDFTYELTGELIPKAMNEDFVPVTVKYMADLGRHLCGMVEKYRKQATPAGKRGTPAGQKGCLHINIDSTATQGGFQGRATP